MGSVIDACTKPDDISVGDYITILQGEMIESPTMIGEMVTLEDNRLKGWIFKIVAIDLPFIICEVISTGWKPKTSDYQTPNTNTHTGSMFDVLMHPPKESSKVGGRIVLNIRNIMLKKLHKDFVDEIMEKK